MKRPGLLLPLSLAALLAVPAAQAAEVTIYRCTGANGQLTLRDTPCRKGEKQEARRMVRPTDPPPRPASAVSARETSPAREPAPRYVMVTPPQPLYECITSDGEHYTSDTGEGRARWEPMWTYGYPAYPMRSGGGYSANIGVRSGNVTGNVRIGERFPPAHPPVLVPAVPAGQWVRDECHRLPQAEVCDRLRDERYELNRRWNIAQPSDRAQIDLKTRGIDARLGNDCGGS